MKKTLYFPHDFNAHNDEKILYLLSKQGYFGYGIYWALIETLHETTNCRINTDLIEGLSYQFNVDITKLNSVMETCIKTGLLRKEDNFILSDRVLQNIKDLEEFRQKKSFAGKQGMANRWDKNNSVITKNNSVITKNNSVITKHNITKEKKRKEKILQADACEEVWDNDKYIKTILEDKRYQIQIIGYYWMHKQFKFPTKEAAQSTLKRDLRPAKDLLGYPIAKIEAVMDYLNKNADFKWTLESVLKYINES